MTCPKARGKSTHCVWHPPIVSFLWLETGRGRKLGSRRLTWGHWSNKLRKVSLHREVTQWFVWGRARLEKLRQFRGQPHSEHKEA